jgi:hypothetical protein
MHGVDGAVERKKGHRIIMGAQFLDSTVNTYGTD